MKDFKECIYNGTNPLLKRYTFCDGELFEKRFELWMRNNNYYRITYKLDSYYHKIFSNKGFTKILRYLEEIFH